MLANEVISGAPVVDKEEQLQGVVTLADIQRIPLAERAKRSIKEIMNTEVLTLDSYATLDEALEQLTSARVSWAPVVERDPFSSTRKILGILTAASIAQVYRRTLANDSRRMRGVVEGTVMLETKIEAHAPLVNKPLREAGVPPECLIVSIRRDGELVFPRGGSVIQAGDTVTFLVSPQGEEQLQDYLANRVPALQRSW